MTISNELKHLKHDFPYFKEVNSQSLQVSFTNLDEAFNKFFKEKSGFPKFKRKSGKQSFTALQSCFMEDGKLSLPKFREGLEIVLHKKFKGIIKSVTISKTPTGKYFASILTDTGNVAAVKKPIVESTSIAIDLGLTNFAILSDGRKQDNPRYLRDSLCKLKFLQHGKDRKVKGSNRHKKAAKKVAKVHEIIANQRKDFLHKLSTNLVKSHDTICVETLKVKNMIKNHCLALSIGDAGWGEFVRMLEYKCEWNGKNLLKMDTFEASSKECFCCEWRNENLQLADREWVCGGCGTRHDRDINAAQVIRKKCLRRAERSLQDAEVSPIRLPKRRRKRAVEALKVQNLASVSSDCKLFLKPLSL